MEVKDTILHLDSNFIRTFIALMKKPGQFIRAYLFGKRADFVSPVKYLFIVVALNVALSFILDRPAISPVWIEQDGQNISNQMLSLLTSLVFILLMVPFGVGMRIAARKTGYCFVEHLSFLFYILSQAILLFIMLQLILNAMNALLNGPIEGLIWFILFTVFYIRSYPAYSGEKGRKAFGSISLSYLIALTLIGSIMGITGLLVNHFVNSSF